MWRELRQVCAVDRITIAFFAAMPILAGCSGSPRERGPETPALVPAACKPACGPRECGPEPICGTSCGVCAPETYCNASGLCQLSSPNAPRFLSFTASLETMHPGDAILFMAELIDPDGIEDIVGGVLLDLTTEAPYGVFAAGAESGTFDLTLTWNEINDVAPIDGPEAGVRRSFTAEFEDRAGERASRALSLTLACDTTGHSICSGHCVDLMVDPDNCGACDTPLEDVAAMTCTGGQPVCIATFEEYCDGSCTDVRTDPDHCGWCWNSCFAGASTQWCEGGHCGADVTSSERRRCADICADRWRACRAADPAGELSMQATYSDGTVIDLADCSTVPPETVAAASFVQVTCLCEEHDGSTCIPRCEGSRCGPDGCGGYCSPGCSADQACHAFDFDEYRQCTTELCSNRCASAFDDRCDDGGPGSSSGGCAYGEDCGDCGSRPFDLCDDSCPSANDDSCDDGGAGSTGEACANGTDCSDCGARLLQWCDDSCTLANDGACTDGGPATLEASCAFGSDCTDCGTR